MALTGDPFLIPELLENMLCYLSYYDLQQAQLVHSCWHSLIKSSPLLQRQLWKLPERSQNFQNDVGNSWNAIANMICPGGRSLFLKKYHTMKRVLHDDIVSQEIWTSYEDEECEFRRNLREHHEAKCGCVVETAIQCCNKCGSVHPVFCYPNIHPILEGLDRFVCVTGEQSALIACICVIGEANCPFLITRLFNLAMYLIRLPKHWQTCKNDMFARQICSRFIVTSGRGCHVLESKAGVTVGGAVVAFISETCDNLRALREWDFDLLIDDAMWSGTGTWLEVIDERLAAMFKDQVRKVREERCDDYHIASRGETAEEAYLGQQYALGVLRDYLVEKLMSLKESICI